MWGYYDGISKITLFNGHFRNRFIGGPTVYIEPIVQGYIREDPTKYGLIWSSTSV